MLACAFGDVHGRQNLELLRQSREKLEACDLIMLAGDVTDGNDIDVYGQVLGALRELSDGEIVAVFGNEEYDTSRPDYRQRFRIIFLEEEAKDLELDGVKVRVVGSTGSLDRPTWWQRNNVPDIWKRYKDRATKISSLLERGEADALILLTHYAPTYATLEGEKPSTYPEMGSNLFESLVMERSPDLVIHAHSHRGKRKALLTKRQRNLEDFGEASREVSVYNVSLPATGGPTFFEIRGEGDGVEIGEWR
jgi:Icc-related predicted phosphoesterase